jgi:hypothetical protein
MSLNFGARAQIRGLEQTVTTCSVGRGRGGDAEREKNLSRAKDVVRAMFEG